MKKKSKTNETERRLYPRIQKLSLISYKSQKAFSLMFGRTIDISASGARVEIHEPITVGAGIELNIEAGKYTTTIQGKVARVTEVEDGVFLAGIKFNQHQKQLR